MNSLAWVQDFPVLTDSALQWSHWARMFHPPLVPTPDSFCAFVYAVPPIWEAALPWALPLRGCPSSQELPVSVVPPNLPGSSLVTPHSRYVLAMELSMAILYSFLVFPAGFLSLIVQGTNRNDNGIIKQPTFTDCLLWARWWGWSGNQKSDMDPGIIELTF